MHMNDGNGDRHILDDDELIDLDETRKIMGGVSVSSAYANAELMALKISMTPGGRRTRMVRFIKCEVHALRAERVARAKANAAMVKAEVEARVEQRRVRQRQRSTVRFAE